MYVCLVCAYMLLCVTHTHTQLNYADIEVTGGNTRGGGMAFNQPSQTEYATVVN